MLAGRSTLPDMLLTLRKLYKSLVARLAVSSFITVMMIYFYTKKRQLNFQAWAVGYALPLEGTRWLADS